MGREIPASAFERGDEEARTWDEMGLGESPFTPEYDDSPDDEDEDYDEDYEPETLDEWLYGETEPITRATQTHLLAELDRKIAELEDRLYYRRMAIVAGEVADPRNMSADEAELAELVEFRRVNSQPIVENRGARESPHPLPPESEHGKRGRSPVRQVEIAISEQLTPSELLHWHELLKGTTQQVIAEKLGIKQAAVSKREGKLRERVDAISIETVGRPYPERLVERGLWARQGRRRNKSASRQR